MTGEPYVETEIEREISTLYYQRAKLEFGTPEYEGVMDQLRALQEREAARMLAQHNADFARLEAEFESAISLAKKLLGET